MVCMTLRGDCIWWCCLCVFAGVMGSDRCLAWCMCLMITTEAFPVMTGWHGNPLYDISLCHFCCMCVLWWIGELQELCMSCKQVHVSVCLSVLLSAFVCVYVCECLCLCSVCVCVWVCVCLCLDVCMSVCTRACVVCLSVKFSVCVTQDDPSSCLLIDAIFDAIQHCEYIVS